MAAKSNTISLKLLVETTSQRVLFAEAGKEFVDFLFNFLTQPIGNVTWLLTKQEMVGCLGNLYGSLETMDDTYVLPTAQTPIVSNDAATATATATANAPALFPTIQPSRKSIEFYTCSYNYNSSCRRYVANRSKSICPACNNAMNQTVTIVQPATIVQPDDEGGYVKGVITYMIMDDLVVKPMSAISCITLLNKFNVKDVGILQEKTVDIGRDEGVKLLKASLQSKTVLTDVFLEKKAAGESDVSDSSGGVHSIVI